MQRISKKSVLLWRIRLSAAAIAVSSLDFLLVPLKVAIPVFAIVLWVFCFFFFFYIPRKYKNTAFFLDRGMLCIKGGVIYRVKRYISPEKVQYINFFATPLERLMGMYNARILASGATGGLPCLDKEGRELLLKLVERV